MSKPIDPLTEQQLVQATPGDKERKLFDGGGLYLSVSPTGAKRWRMKFRDRRGKENVLTFGPYPEVSLALARCRRSVARQMLRDRLDPRIEFDHDHMRSQKHGNGRRLLPAAIDRKKLALSATRTGTAALKSMGALTFPASSRVSADRFAQGDMSALIERIQNERGVEVVDLLYDICAEIIWSCVSAGIDEGDVLDAMTDARMVQRRLREI
jgi:hypothetical protein